jgi:hypothetical protein
MDFSMPEGMVVPRFGACTILGSLVHWSFRFESHLGSVRTPWHVGAVLFLAETRYLRTLRGSELACQPVTNLDLCTRRATLPSVFPFTPERDDKCNVWTDFPCSMNHRLECTAVASVETTSDVLTKEKWPALACLDRSVSLIDYIFFFPSLLS